MTRRQVFGVIGASVAAATIGCQKGAPAAAPKEGALPSQTAAVPKRRLGRTGVEVSMVGLGGHHIGTPSEQEAIRIIRTAIDRGVTFMDNCWDYHGGKSEERMGKALRDGYRERAFLMSKIDGRTRDAAAAQIDQSLRRLQTERIDLMQIHEVIRDTDPGRCFGPGGCMEALVRAREAGKIRFIGFTGHKDPRMHLGMLEAARRAGFRFDTVQMPLNVLDAHFRSFERDVLPALVKDEIGVLGMKSMAAGAILETKTATAVECLHYAMNLPTSVVITGCESVGVLEQAIDAAVRFRPMDAPAVAALLERTRAVAMAGKHEKFKTADTFDGTAQNPKWLESAEI